MLDGCGHKSARCGSLSSLLDCTDHVATGRLVVIANTWPLGEYIEYPSEYGYNTHDAERNPHYNIAGKQYSVFKMCLCSIHLSSNYQYFI